MGAFPIRARFSKVASPTLRVLSMDIMGGNCMAIARASPHTSIAFYMILVSPGFGPISAQEASRNTCIFSVFCRSMRIREDVGCGGIQEEFRHALAQGIGHDQLRGRYRPGRTVRSQEPKAYQTRCGKATARVLKQSLTDDSRLDEDVVGVQLAPDGVAVAGRRAMEVLVAAAAAQRLHVGHPEVVAERADQPDRLLERVFDLKRRP